MNKKSVVTTLALLALCTVAWATATVWDSTNFTMSERKWQPAPTGHVAGKDNGVETTGHHADDDCGICHASNGVAASKPFTLTATIYEGRTSRRPVEGAEVVFQDYEGNVFSMVSNDQGMMWTEAVMAGDASLGDPTDSNYWRYKAWVVDEGGERPMMTIPAVGGMMVPRMSCNMHHVVSGTLGGLWARPASTLESYPATGLSYAKHIFPILRSKCGPCHIPGPTQADRGGELFDYGSDLDLMNYSGSFVTLDLVDYDKIGVVDIVNTVNPDASLLLAKTVVGSFHGGGAFWDEGAADYLAIHQWIKEGALEN